MKSTRHYLKRLHRKNTADIINKTIEIYRFKYELYKIVNSIDKHSFHRIYNLYKSSSPFPGYNKYLNYRCYIEYNLYHSFDLHIHTCTPLYIHDIGTGWVYFPYICQYYGHKVNTIDLDEIPMYREVINCLNINRNVFSVNAYKNILALGNKFDLITTFMICFNGHDSAALWDIDEWHFFTGSS